MEGRGPYRIYDPGGSVPPGEASAAFERLVEENSRLKEKMQGIKMLGKADRALSRRPCPCSAGHVGLCPSIPLSLPVPHWHLPCSWVFMLFCSVVGPFPALNPQHPRTAMTGLRIL